MKKTNDIKTLSDMFGPAAVSESLLPKAPKSFKEDNKRLEGIVKASSLDKEGWVKFFKKNPEGAKAAWVNAELGSCDICTGKIHYKYDHWTNEWIEYKEPKPTYRKSAISAWVKGEEAKVVPTLSYRIKKAWEDHKIKKDWEVNNKKANSLVDNVDENFGALTFKDLEAMDAEYVNDRRKTDPTYRMGKTNLTRDEMIEMADFVYEKDSVIKPVEKK